MFMSGSGGVDPGRWQYGPSPLSDDNSRNKWDVCHRGSSQLRAHSCDQPAQSPLSLAPQLIRESL